MAHHAVPIHDQIMMPTPHTPPHITSYGEFPHSSVLTVFYKVVVAADVSRTSIPEITIINFENQLVFSCLVCLSSLVPVSLTKINHRRVNPNYEGTPVVETHDGCIKTEEGQGPGYYPVLCQINFHHRQVRRITWFSVLQLDNFRNVRSLRSRGHT